MRLLFVTHRYPPDGNAGVETYVARVAAIAAARGHEVRVVTAVKDIARTDLSAHERTWQGIPVTEIVDNLYSTEFRETWDRPEVDARFARIAGAFRPDVVHVHHLMYLSAGVLDVCERLRLPVVLTLHDFWFGCARFGQLLHADGSRCDVVDPARCGTCLPSLRWRQSDAARRVGRAVALVKRTMGIDLSGPLARVHRQRQSVAPDVPPEVSAALAEEERAYEAAVVERNARLVALVHRAVDRVIVPARFMVPWFTALGFPEDRMRVVHTGVEWEAFADVGRTLAPDRTLRFLFLGTLVPHKGPHVVLDAFERLAPDVLARCSLALFGPDEFQPGYVRELRSRAERLGVHVGPGLDRAGVARELARADVLLCPSLWLEIRPMVMVEAFAAGLRCIASDLGGMAELVADGLPGRTVPPGDPDALAAAMAAEVERGPAPPGEVRGAPSALFPTWEMLFEASLPVLLEARERRSGLLG